MIKIVNIEEDLILIEKLCRNLSGKENDFPKIYKNCERFPLEFKELKYEQTEIDFPLGSDLLSINDNLIDEDGLVVINKNLARNNTYSYTNFLCEESVLLLEDIVNFLQYKFNPYRDLLIKDFFDVSSHYSFVDPDIALCKSVDEVILNRYPSLKGYDQSPGSLSEQTFSYISRVIDVILNKTEIEDFLKKDPALLTEIKYINTDICLYKKTDIRAKRYDMMIEEESCYKDKSEEELVREYEEEILNRRAKYEFKSTT